MSHQYRPLPVAASTEFDGRVHGTSTGNQAKNTGFWPPYFDRGPRAFGIRTHAGYVRRCWIARWAFETSQYLA